MSLRDILSDPSPSTVAGVFFLIAFIMGGGLLPRRSRPAVTIIKKENDA